MSATFTLIEILSLLIDQNMLDMASAAMADTVIKVFATAPEKMDLKVNTPT